MEKSSDNKSPGLEASAGSMTAKHQGKSLVLGPSEELWQVHTRLVVLQGQLILDGELWDQFPSAITGYRIDLQAVLFGGNEDRLSGYIRESAASKWMIFLLSSFYNKLLTHVPHTLIAYNWDIKLTAQVVNVQNVAKQSSCIDAPATYRH